MTGPDDMQLHRDMGRLEGKFAGIETQVAQVQASQESMQKKVDAIHDAMMQAKGGWRLMFVVGSASAAMGALVSSLLGVFHK